MTYIIYCNTTFIKKRQIKRKKTPSVCVYVAICVRTHRERREGYTPNCYRCFLRGMRLQWGRQASGNTDRWQAAPGERKNGSWACLLPCCSLQHLVHLKRTVHICAGLPACPPLTMFPDSRSALFLAQGALDKGSRPLGRGFQYLWYVESGLEGASQTPGWHTSQALETPGSIAENQLSKAEGSGQQLQGPRAKASTGVWAR